MSASTTPAGDRAVYVAVPEVVEVTPPAGAASEPSGARFRSGVQDLFAGHKTMGSDGLAEIVTLQMTRDEASELERSLSERIATLRTLRASARET